MEIRVDSLKNKIFRDLFFKKIFILDGKKKIKTTIKNVKFLINYLKKYHNKKPCL